VKIGFFKDQVEGDCLVDTIVDTNLTESIGDMLDISGRLTNCADSVKGILIYVMRMRIGLGDRCGKELAYRQMGSTGNTANGNSSNGCLATTGGQVRRVTCS